MEDGQNSSVSGVMVPASRMAMADTDLKMEPGSNRSVTHLGFGASASIFVRSAGLSSGSDAAA